MGRLVTTLIQRTGDRLGENLDLLLKAVLSKLQGSQTLSVIQVGRTSLKRPYMEKPQESPWVPVSPIRSQIVP